MNFFRRYKVLTQSLVRMSAVSLCVLFLAPPPVFAESDLMEDIVVIGSMNDVRRVPGSGKSLDELTLERFDFTDLGQLLGGVPGVYIREEDGYGLRPNIGIRGAAAERSQKITIMEDGVLITPAPYSAPAAYYVPNISRMENIEVLKGPSAIRHGPHTVGGAVNFITKSPPKDLLAVIDASFGNEGFYKLQGTAGNSTQQVGWLVDALSYGSDGFKDLDSGGDTGFVRNELNARIVLNLDTAVPQRLSFKLGWSDEDSDETYLGLTDDDFEQDPYRRYTASQLANFQSDHLSLHGNYSIQFDTNRALNAKVYYNEFGREWNKLDGFIAGPDLLSVLSRPESFVDEYRLLTGQQNSLGTPADTLDVTNNDRTFESYGVQITGFQQLSAGGFEHSLTAGLRFHYDEVDRDHRQRGYLMTNGNLVFDGIDRGSKVVNFQSTDAISLFLNDEIDWHDFTFTIGARYENIDGELDDERLSIRASSEQNFVSLGAGVYWQFTESIGFLGGVYRGFSPAAPGSGDVDPEESVNYEIGVRYDSGPVSAEAVGFFSDYNNLLGRCRVSDFGCNPGDEFNGGAVEIAGLEFSTTVEVPVSETYTLFSELVYTYTQSEFKETFLSGFSQWGRVIAGDELPYLPEHTVQLQAGVSNERWRFWGTVKSRSEMRELPGTGSISQDLHSDSLTTLDLTAGLFFNEHWEGQLIVQNVGDEASIVSHRPYGARPNRSRAFIGRVKFSL
ncbi:MAG: Fe(3+) dicitrate transport protein [Litorivivens sp.]|jgi:Fe(3+) dicitrate transport protein